jgi:hypothetical protein
MKEIGGYLELERPAGQEYHHGLLALNTGRNAVAYLIKARKIRKLYIPLFLCDCVEAVCQREGCEYEYYPVGKDFLPIFDRTLADGEWLYVVNFYGQLSNAVVRQLKRCYVNLIFDNAHAFFQLPVQGVDTIYTCRKFFGVPDGAYLATDAVFPEPLEKDRSAGRMSHLLGRLESGASEHYQAFKANDASFRELPVRWMSELTHCLLRGIDYSGAREQRNQNYAVLVRALDAKNGMDFAVPDGPYAYPFYCENGMQAKRLLAKEGIYVATLWPNVLEAEGTTEKKLAENILPLPCDQRYDAADMMRIIEEVRKCIG